MNDRITKLMGLCLLVLVLVSTQTSAASNLINKPTKVGDAIALMNTYIDDNYSKYVTDAEQLDNIKRGLILSSLPKNKYPIQEVWEKYDVIAYDESVYQREVKANPVTPRYLGIAVNGSTEVPNMSHPIDSWTDGRTYEYYNWIKEPWVTPDGSVKGSKGQAISKETYRYIQSKWGVNQLPFDGLASAPFEDKIRECTNDIPNIPSNYI